MQPIDYCVELAEGRIAPPANLDLATIQQQELAMAFRFHISQYLIAPRRGLEGAGASPRRSTDCAALNARSKFWGDDQRAAFKNWEEVADPRNPLGGRQGVNERIMLRELLRRVDMMVILENQLDALVRLHTPWPPGLIGGAYQYDIASNLRAGIAERPERRPDRGADPGGLRHDGLRSGVRAQPGRHALRLDSRPTRRPTIPAPGLPFSLVFRAEPGKEDVLLRIASAYEAASQAPHSAAGFRAVVGALPASSGASRATRLDGNAALPRTLLALSG